MGNQGPRDFLNSMHDAADGRVRLLYKYRSCTENHIQCLREDKLWFSTHPDLNDPFDCLIRLPRTLSQRDINDLRDYLSDAQPYVGKLSDALAIAQHVGKSTKLPKLEPLGLLAAQFKDQALLKHIGELHINSDAWLKQLFLMARATAERLLHQIAVFCVSEHNDSQLMWAHYAASHTGFCVGYVCPTGILNPQVIHKVQYESAPLAVSARQLIDDPGDVYQNLVLTKPPPIGLTRQSGVSPSEA